MAREITLRELRNETGKIMRAVERGQTFVVTRNGVPVGELKPLRQRQFVAAEAAMAVFAGAPAVDLKRFRADLDALVDQDAAPKAQHAVALRTRGGRRRRAPGGARAGRS